MAARRQAVACRQVVLQLLEPQLVERQQAVLVQTLARQQQVQVRWVRLRRAVLSRLEQLRRAAQPKRVLVQTLAEPPWELAFQPGAHQPMMILRSCWQDQQVQNGHCTCLN